MSDIAITLEQLQTLRPEQQQQVIDFVAFLQSKNEKSLSPTQTDFPAIERSALEAAGDLVGCIDGPTDLSTNKAYMQGFGQS